MKNASCCRMPIKHKLGVYQCILMTFRVIQKWLFVHNQVEGEDLWTPKALPRYSRIRALSQFVILNISRSNEATQECLSVRGRAARILFWATQMRAPWGPLGTQNLGKNQSHQYGHQFKGFDEDTNFDPVHYVPLLYCLTARGWQRFWKKCKLFCL